jgi:hypothetical protein
MTGCDYVAVADGKLGITLNPSCDLTPPGMKHNTAPLCHFAITSLMVPRQ